MSSNLDAVKLKGIKEKCLEENENKKILSAKKYSQFFLGNKSTDDEVCVYIKDAYVVISEINRSLDKKNKKLDKMIELFNSEGQKIAESDEMGKLIFEQELLDKEISQQIIDVLKVIETQKENGLNLSIAGRNENKGFDIYVQFIEEQVLTITERQKEIEDIENKRTGKNEGLDKQKILDNKEDEKVNNAEEQEQQRIKQMSKDLGIDQGDVFQITEIKDDLFYSNNKMNGRNDCYALRTRSGEIMIVNKNNDGNYEKTKGFEKSTKESGRTAIMTNDDNNLRENNFYGAVYPDNKSGLRYVCEIGSYGEIKLVEQRRITQNESGQTIENYEMWSPGREVQTNNTAYLDVDRKGIGSDNDLRSMYNMTTNENLRMNKEASKVIRKGAENLTPETLTDTNIYTKVNVLMEKINENLEEKNIKISDEYKKKIESFLLNKDVTLTDEEIDKLSEFIRADSQSQKDIENATKEDINNIQENEHEENHDDYESNEGRSRLDEAYDRMFNRGRNNN